MIRLSLTALAAVSTCFAASAQAKTLTFDDVVVGVIAEGAPDQAFSQGNFPDDDRVSVDRLTTDYSPGTRARADAMIRFDDFDLGPGANVVSATLKFFTKSASVGPVTFSQLLEPFSSTTTWNDFGGDGITFGDEANFQGSVQARDIQDESPLEVDITAIVQAWASGASALGIGIVNASADGWDFQTLTDGKEFAPYLVVELGDPVPVPAAALLFAPVAAGFVLKRKKRAA